MTAQDFDYICRLLQERSAILLEPGKEYLVETRLAPVVRQRRLSSISELVSHLRDRPAPNLLSEIVEALVTTETSFFRDHAPFETLRRNVLPELMRRRGRERQLNIWCAACSTGQEPYSLAILVREHFPELLTWKLSLLATDISAQVLARARQGVYNQIEVNRGLPAALLIKYFEQHGTTWQLRDTIRSMVEFRELNLDRPWPSLPRMDVILIRNVMIYFHVDTKKAIFARLARALQSDGYLLLGGAETTFNLSNAFRRVEELKTGFYQLLPE